TSNFKLPGRHRVIAATAPRVAAADTPDREQAAFHGSVLADGLGRVLRTTGRETTLSQRTKQSGLGGRYHPLIQSHGKNQNVLRPIHLVLNNPAFRSIAKNASSTAARPLPTIIRWATKTSSTGCARSCWCNRNTSRSRRRARARTTALPSFFAVITPRRVSDPGGRVRQLAMKQPHASRLPSCRTRAKSRLCFRRIRRLNKQRGCGVAAMPCPTLIPG